MSRMFFPKLAAINVKKNGKIYLPYILTCIFTIAMYYMMNSLALNEGIKQTYGAEYISMTMSFGCGVAALFSIIFLFYTNSFLMKRRKKEFGLFNILGMEKKHIARLIAYENIYIAVIGIVIGLVFGIALDKLMYLIIMKVIDCEITLGFYVSLKGIMNTLYLFAFIFILIFLHSMFQVYKSQPIELMKSKNIGEKEPKTKWIMTVLGLICLAVGYYLAVSIENPIAALSSFFIAVILVIVATYLLFISGSIALLKILRKNKNYYYKTKNFISVSGMIYRMKQNAVGLANICVLSTMVLVMVSSTVSLMVGIDEIQNTRYPYDIAIYYRSASDAEDKGLEEIADHIMEVNNYQFESNIFYNYLTFAAVKDGNEYLIEKGTNFAALDNIENLFFISLSDYNYCTGENKTLNDGETMIYSNRGKYREDNINIFDRSYKIIEHLEDFPGNGLLASHVADSQFIVVKGKNEIEYMYEMQKDIYGKNASNIQKCYAFNIAGTSEEKLEVYNQIAEEINNSSYDYQSLRIESKEETRAISVSLYGSIFFLGVFLGLLFIMATILIIYYKQISEGYEDKERFEIMQKVGLSHAEVKKAIHSQIITVFFLPIVTAGLHTAFAFPAVMRILAIFNLINTRLFALCTIGTFIVFAALYGLIYSITAKQYYKIVQS